MVTHERDIQVNVDISTTRVRFAGLKDKTSEIDAKKRISNKNYHGRRVKGLDSKRC